jgi:hypothetical protein
VAEAEDTVTRRREPSLEKVVALHAVLGSFCGGSEPGG